MRLLKSDISDAQRARLNRKDQPGTKARHRFARKLVHDERIGTKVKLQKRLWCLIDRGITNDFSLVPHGDSFALVFKGEDKPRAPRARPEPRRFKHVARKALPAPLPTPKAADDQTETVDFGHMMWLLKRQNDAIQGIGNAVDQLVELFGSMVKRQVDLTKHQVEVARQERLRIEHVTKYPMEPAFVEVPSEPEQEG